MLKDIFQKQFKFDFAYLKFMWKANFVIGFVVLFLCFLIRFFIGIDYDFTLNATHIKWSAIFPISVIVFGYLSKKKMNNIDRQNTLEDKVKLYGQALRTREAPYMFLYAFCLVTFLKHGRIFYFSFSAFMWLLQFVSYPNKKSIAQKLQLTQEEKQIF